MHVWNFTLVVLTFPIESFSDCRFSGVRSAILLMQCFGGIDMVTHNASGSVAAVI